MSDLPCSGPPSPHELPTLPPAQPGLLNVETMAPALPGLSAAGPGPAAEVRADVPGYEILRELGRGGMGVVYLARQQKLNRLVALKMVLAGGHASDTDLARFLAEAEAVAQLQHPNIVPLLESGQHDGLPYFTLEYVGGGSLADQLKGTPLPPAQAAALVEQLARGIHAAHTHDIIHRDLKPANVLLAADGRPRVTDFGLARRVQTGTAGLTATGAIMGTPSYMAPEQAEGKGKQVGPTADVYALGAILYECLTGRPPFQGPTPLETLAQVVSDEAVPPTQLVRAVPRDLETISLKCLQKNPQRRYATALELADDLARFQRGEPIVARPIGRLERAVKWMKRKPAAAALLTVTVLAALALTISGVLFTLKLDAARTNAEQALDRETEARLKLEVTGKERDRLLVESNRFLAQTSVLLARSAWRDNNVTLANEVLDRCPQDRRGWEWHYLKRRSLGRQLTLYGATGNASFSPDGRFVAAGAVDNSVRIWDASTGRVVLTLHGHINSVNSVAFSPNGRQLASGGEDRTVRLWDARSGKQLQVLDKNAGPVGFITYSRDGGRLAVSSRIWNEAANESTGRRIRLWDVHTGELLREWRSIDGGCDEISFSPDGDRLVAVTKDFEAFDTRSGEAVRLSKSGAESGNAVVFGPERGQLALALGDSVALRDANADREARRFKGHADTVVNLCFSPDRRRLASLSFDRTARIWDLGMEEEILTIRGNALPFSSIRFSPDGGRVLFNSWDGSLKIWDARSNPEALTFKFDAESVSFSPDGHQLMAVNSLSGARTWDSVFGHELSRRHDRTGTNAQSVSCPDGRWLARGYPDGTLSVWDLTADKEIFHVPAHEGPVSTVCVDVPHELIASGGDDGMVRVWGLKSGKEVGASRKYGARVSALTFSSSGQRLASSGDGPVVKVWDVQTGQQIHAVPTDGWRALCFGPNENRLIFGTWGDRGTPALVLWDLETDQSVVTLRGHNAVIVSVCFAPGSALLASGDNGGTIKIWDVKSGQEVLSFKGHARSVTALSFSPSGEQLASVGEDRSVKLWDARPVSEPPHLQGHTGPVSGVGFSPDSGYLATASKDKTIRLWDVSTGKCTGVLEGHTEEVKSVAFSPNGKLLASASVDKTIRVWDLNTRTEIFKLVGHDGPVANAAFSHDGNFLVSIDAQGDKLKVWDIRTGTEVISLVQNGEVYGAAFARDNRVVAYYRVGTSQAWDLRTGKETTLPDPLPLPTFPSSPFSPDDRYFASMEGNDVVLRNLEPTPEELKYRQGLAAIDAGWHDWNAADAESSGQWFAVAFHLDRVIAAGRPNWETYKRRGQARAVLGRWNDAVSDLTRALESAPADQHRELWNGLGLAALGAGQNDDYRRQCGRLIESATRVSDAPLGAFALAAAPANPFGHAAVAILLSKEAGERVGPRTQAARCAVVGPAAVSDPAALLRLVSHDDKELRGAVLYRAGKHEEAAELLAESSTAPALLYLALAELGRRRVTEARQAFDRAKQWLDAPSASQPKLSNEASQTALARLEIILLRREFEALAKK